MEVGGPAMAVVFLQQGMGAVVAVVVVAAVPGHLLETADKTALVWDLVALVVMDPRSVLALGVAMTVKG